MASKKLKLPKIGGKENAENSEETKLTKKRGKYFSSPETDLLLELVMQSDLCSQVTNKITPYGRLRTWEDIEKVYNASPVVINVIYLYFSYCVQ